MILGTVKCVEAPIGYEHLQGEVGVLSQSSSIWFFHVNGERYETSGNDGWRFETMPKRRQQERRCYDAEAFASDLDDAISHLKLHAVGWEKAPVSFSPGVDMREAFGTLLVASFWNALGGSEKQAHINQVLRDTRALLIEKNAAYGDSALNPVRVFSKASTSEQLLVRLDDKVSRLVRGDAAGEDVIKDMMGYILLVLVAQIREERNADQ